MVEINNFKRKFTITNSTIAIIVNYNDAQRTINLVKDIIDYQALKNVIVVNNNSTDNSIEILSDFEHPKYLIINSEINGGYGYGNNLGIKKAKNRS
ncbi:glycosyltransferase [Streptococcus parauberis]|nr:glycosyltransferase [Streptococcus parauberis]